MVVNTRSRPVQNEARPSAEFREGLDDAEQDEALINLGLAGHLICTWLLRHPEKSAKELHEMCGDGVYSRKALRAAQKIFEDVEYQLEELREKARKKVTEERLSCEESFTDQLLGVLKQSRHYMKAPAYEPSLLRRPVELPENPVEFSGLGRHGCEMYQVSGLDLSEACIIKPGCIPDSFFYENDHIVAELESKKAEKISGKSLSVCRQTKIEEDSTKSHLIIGRSIPVFRHVMWMIFTAYRMMNPFLRNMEDRSMIRADYDSKTFYYPTPMKSNAHDDEGALPQLQPLHTDHGTEHLKNAEDAYQHIPMLTICCVGREEVLAKMKEQRQAERAEAARLARATEGEDARAAAESLDQATDEDEAKPTYRDMQTGFMLSVGIPRRARPGLWTKEKRELEKYQDFFSHIEEGDTNEYFWIDVIVVKVPIGCFFVCKSNLIHGGGHPGIMSDPQGEQDPQKKKKKKKKAFDEAHRVHMYVPLMLGNRPVYDSIHTKAFDGDVFLDSVSRTKASGKPLLCGDGKKNKESKPVLWSGIDPRQNGRGEKHFFEYAGWKDVDFSGEVSRKRPAPLYEQ